MTDFETALDPRFTMYAGDIAADKKAVEGVPAAIDLAVDRLKELLRRNAFDSNAGMYHALHRIGQLLDMRNRLTGEHKNEIYLIFDDAGHSCHVSGFVGDPAGVFDSQGRPLQVGDIVAGSVREQEVKRMVILNARGESMLSREWIDQHDAVFVQDFSAARVQETNRYPGCRIWCHGCLKEYHAAQDRQCAQEKRKLAQQIRRGDPR